MFWAGMRLTLRAHAVAQHRGNPSRSSATMATETSPLRKTIARAVSSPAFLAGRFGHTHPARDRQQRVGRDDAQRRAGLDLGVSLNCVQAQKNIGRKWKIVLACYCLQNRRLNSSSATILRGAASGSIGERRRKWFETAGWTGKKWFGEPTAAKLAAMRSRRAGSSARRRFPAVRGSAGRGPRGGRLGREHTRWSGDSPRGTFDRLAAFRERVVHEIPPAAEIHAITVEGGQRRVVPGFLSGRRERLTNRRVGKPQVRV